MGWGGIGIQRFVVFCFNFFVGLVGDFDVEVDDLGFGFVGVERDVVLEGDGFVVFFKLDMLVL